MIARSGSRTARQEGWKSRALLLSIASSMTGMVLGAVLGTLGAQLQSESRIILGTVLLMALMALGAFEAFEVRVPLVELSRQTPRHWLEHSFWGPLKNGAAFGSGFTTKIGFWSWYLIPFSCFLLGSTAKGVLIYGTYATTRGLGVWLIMGWLHLAHRRQPGSQVMAGDWLVGHYRPVRAMTGAFLAGVATFGFVLIGF